MVDVHFDGSSNYTWVGGVLLHPKKYQEPEEDAVLEMHNEALDLIDDIAEEEQEEITQALKSDEPEELLTSRINSRGGPL